MKLSYPLVIVVMAASIIATFAAPLWPQAGTAEVVI
jgi:hypothetical protein